MVVKGGKHRLVGFVELGPLHDDMLALEGKLFKIHVFLHIMQDIVLRTTVLLV